MRVCICVHACVRVRSCLCVCACLNVNVPSVCVYMSALCHQPVSVGRVSIEKPGAILTWVRDPGAARDFSQSQLRTQTFLLYSHSRRVQSHASSSVGTLKISNTAATSLSEHMEIPWLHDTLLRMGSAALAAAVMPYPRKVT